MLQDQLDAITQRTRALVQPERLAPSERAIAELFHSGIEDHILPVGATAPDFTLADSAGRSVRLRDLLTLGPVILNFFRGRWCSYCVHELEAWQQLYPALLTRRAVLIGISPQTPRQNAFTAEQHGIGFPLLTDERAAIAEGFGLAYTVPDYLRSYYRSILVNLPFMNGEPSYRMLLPATYVVAQDGIVLYAQAHADFRVRPEPVDVVLALP